MLADPNITKAELAKHFAVSSVMLNAALNRTGNNAAKNSEESSTNSPAAANAAETGLWPIEPDDTGT